MMNDEDQKSELRKRAEEILLQSNIKAEELKTQNITNIVHELQVHQIELEMQNDNLRKSQLELDDAYEKYFNLYNLAPLGYLTISDKGEITEANMTTSFLLGIDKNILLNQHITNFIIPEDQDIFYLHNKALFETGIKQQFDIRMKQKEGTIFWAAFNSVTVKVVNGHPYCNAIIKDISDRKLLEIQLMEQNEIYKQINSELNKARERADISEHLRTSSLANLSREVKTPLKAIIDYAQSINNPNLTKDKKKEITDSIINRCNQLMRFFEDIK
ncbi:MAG: PAS domain S-box protein [Bacteroidota bacterium]|nr:PAS domain S-box protein [Bacteroidota bacterium]